SAFCPAAGRSFDDVRHVTRSPVYRDVDRRQTYTAGLPRGHGRMANASLLRRVRDLDWLWLFLASWILPFVIDGVSHLTYFRSLLFWLVPTILLLPRFLEYTDPGGRRRTALWITTAGIVVLGVLLDCVFGRIILQFDESPTANYIGWLRLPQLGVSVPF